MKTKHQVVQFIVDLSEENENLTKSVLGNAVVESAKRALNSSPDLKTLKIIAESILFISKCIEDLEQELRVVSQKRHGGQRHSHEQHLYHRTLEHQDHRQCMRSFY